MLYTARGRGHGRKPTGKGQVVGGGIKGHARMNCIIREVKWLCFPTRLLQYCYQCVRTYWSDQNNA